MIMDTENRRFTQDELMIAKSVDLCDVASSLGYTVKRIGKYHTLKEMDSIRIYDRSHWYRWSRASEKGQNGGSQIDFLRVFEGMNVKDAVFWLLDFSGYQRLPAQDRQQYVKRAKERQNASREKEDIPRKFVLPVPARENRYLYSYLENRRGLSKETIDFFVKKGLIYEAAKYHNIVFKGNDKDGITRFASMRGVYDRDGKGFKCDVAGNDKNYGFNIANDESTEVFVFEAAIDLMSYCDMMDDFHSNMVALGMVSDAPLMTFLKEHPQIGVVNFCLDNDEPGRKATEQLCEKYYSLGNDVNDLPAPKEYKDYNEWLVSMKRDLAKEPSTVKSNVIPTI